MKPREPITAHDEGIEKAMLALILAGNVTVMETTLSVDDFYVEKYAAVFRAMAELETDGISPEEMELLFSKLKKENLPYSWGAVLAEILQSISTTFSASEYITKIKEASEIRRVAGMLASAATRLEKGFSPKEVVDIFQAESHVERDGGKDAFSVASEFLRDFDKKEKKQPVIPTGFSQLDESLNGGLRGGQYIVTAARPSVGKSAFGLNMMIDIAKNIGHVLIFSMEMTRLEIVERIIAIESNIPLNVVQQPWNMSDGEKTEVRNAVERISRLRLTIFDAAVQTPRSIESAIRYGIRKHKAVVAFVDYLGLLTADDSSKFQGLYAQTTQISRQIKQIAMKMAIPVVVAVQLNRESESKKGKADNVPKMSHLRDSGAIEQDANIVMLLHNEHPENDEGTIQVIVAKNRNGRRRTIEYQWEGPHVRFTEHRDSYFSDFDAYSGQDAAAGNFN